jgi:hypothetical protein
MATSNIPYMTVPGTLTKILDKIKVAATPENFNHDFLANTLGFKGGNYRTFIPWAKKIGLINKDGTLPTAYRQFRNPSTSQTTLGALLKKGYNELYARDENCHNLTKDKLKGLFMEVTGEAHDSGTLGFIVNTFWNAKAVAQFDGAVVAKTEDEKDEDVESGKPNEIQEESHSKKLHLGLNYTINLVLPKTDDPSVYNAIFKSLRDNLLK